MIERKELHFEVVTPLYLGGFATRGPEAQTDTRIRLRPIKAMWRYWFRVLWGSLIGTDRQGLDIIQKEETRMFGGVTGDAAAAAFRLRLLQDVSYQNNSIVAYTQDRQHNDAWASYLSYGMGSRIGDPTHRYGIAPDQTFKVELLCDHADWPLLATLIRIWMACGGLGARHRRGVGSLRWLNDPDHPNKPPDFAFLTKSREDLSQHLGAGRTTNVPEFDTLHPNWCRIRLCTRSFPSWQSALTAIRNQLRIPVADQPSARALLQTTCRPAVVGGGRFTTPTVPPPTFCLGVSGFGWRQRWSGVTTWRLAGRWDATMNSFKFAYYQGRDHDRVSTRARGTTLENIRFGLPIAYSSWRNTMIEPELNSRKIRRPSPLSFRVYKVNNRDYRVAVLLFKSVFLPVGTVVKCDGTPVTYPGHYGDLEAFINGCDGTDITF